jgi:hypothetical protein
MSLESSDSILWRYHIGAIQKLTKEDVLCHRKRSGVV